MFQFASKQVVSSAVFRSMSRRTLMTLKEIKYTANATATGAGRNGQVSCQDPPLELDFALPKSLGGTGNGHNPEELLAMGYSACFLGAVHACARQMGKDSSAAIVNASVHIGTPADQPGFGIAVDLKVSGVDDELLAMAHKTCPYSRALSQGAQVKVSKA